MQAKGATVRAKRDVRRQKQELAGFLKCFKESELASKTAASVAELASDLQLETIEALPLSLQHSWVDTSRLALDRGKQTLRWIREQDELMQSNLGPSLDEQFARAHKLITHDACAMEVVVRMD